jgi:hypothetical protein
MVHWLGLLNDSFLAPYLGWVFVAVLAGACVLGLLSLGRRRENTRIEPVAIIGVLQILLALAVLSSTLTLEPRFLFAILPSVVIVFVQLCAYLPARILAVVVVACAAQWAVVNAESLAIVGRFSHQSQWLVTPEFDGSHYDDLTRAVSLTSTANERYDIVAVESKWMNANAASFFAAKNRLRTGVRCYYTSLGYAETDYGTAMRRIEQFRPRFIVTLSEPFQAGLPGFLNVVTLPVLRDMRSDDRFRQVPFASRNGVLVFEFTSGPPADAAAGSAL